MQPAQLSLPLLPDHAPKTPPTAMIALPEPALTAAITVLAGLIAKASTPNATQTGPLVSAIAPAIGWNAPHSKFWIAQASDSAAMLQPSSA